MLRLYDPNGPPRPDLGRVITFDAEYLLNADGVVECKSDPAEASEINQIYAKERLDISNEHLVEARLRQLCIAMRGMSYEVFSTKQKVIMPPLY